MLIMLGLLVEALSLIRIHPLAFLAFMFIGGGSIVDADTQELDTITWCDVCGANPEMI